MLMLVIVFCSIVLGVLGTSVKMDFLPVAVVRTDPVMQPKCLSDHVHTFYGASAVRPETTYDDLRNANGNSGSVEENLSLYWHPTVYEYDPIGKVFTKADMWFASTYYVWETGKTKAWPNGFKMIARSLAADAQNKNDDGTLGITHTNFDCSGRSACEKADCSTTHEFFPATACAELEISFRFPSCWDGVNADSTDHMSHVAYTETGEIDEPCPTSHPVKIPQIRFYFRIKEYKGGSYQFSHGAPDANELYHADYFSDWNETFLQHLLDDCTNPSETAAPDMFCEDVLSFRGTTKVTGVPADDDNIEKKLLAVQPATPIDVTTITTEAITGVQVLPRTPCTGTLLPVGPSLGPSPGPSPGPTEPSERGPSLVSWLGLAGFVIVVVLVGAVVFRRRAGGRDARPDRKWDRVELASGL